MSPCDMTRVRYQPEGERVKPRQAWVAENRLATLETWLTERLGVRVHVLETPLAAPKPEPWQELRHPKSEPKIERQSLQPAAFYPVMPQVGDLLQAEPGKFDFRCRLVC